MIKLIADWVYELLLEGGSEGLHKYKYFHKPTYTIEFDVPVGQIKNVNALLNLSGKEPLDVGRIKYEIEFFDDYCVVHIIGFPGLYDTTGEPTFYYAYPEFPFNMINTLYGRRHHLLQALDSISDSSEFQVT